MATETKEKGKKGLIDKEGSISLSFSIKHEDVALEELLGEGAYGKVYKATWKFNTVAVKTFPAQDFSTGTQQKIREEASVMARVGTHSDYLVKLKGLTLAQPHYSLVMEHLPGGSLYGLLHSDQPIAWSVRYKIGYGISAGLHHLHEENILHCDLKSLNVLLDGSLNAKLCDFGMATLKSTSASTTKKAGGLGTIRWTAPERFKPRSRASKQADIYSTGMIFWELASRKVPFEEENNNDIVRGWIEKNTKEEVPEDCPAEFGQLIHACWDDVLDKRPTAADLAKRLDTLWKTQRALEEKKEKPTPVEGSEAPLNSLAALEKYSDSTSKVESVERVRMAQGIDSGRPLILDPLGVIPKKPDPSSSGGSAPLVMTPPISLPRPPASPTPEQVKLEEMQQKLEKLRLEKQQREMQDEIDRLETEAKAKPKPPVVTGGLFGTKPPPALPKKLVPEKKPVVDTKAVEGLLKLVVEGEQDKAEVLIKEKPELLLGKGKVTDLSGRTFETVTAFQYAVWALDWHMWKMLLSYFTDKGDALAQYEQLASTGLKYTTFISKGLEGLSKTLTSKGPLLEDKGSQQTPHIDALIKALNEYIENAPKWKYDTRAVEHWQKVVGGAQRLLPVHVVNEYCREDRSFDPTPKFLEDVLPRTRKTDEGEWFTGTSNDGLLGEKFAAARGPSQCWFWLGYGEDCEIEYDCMCRGFDHSSLLSLFKTRVQQREELVVTLKSASSPGVSGGKS